MLAKTDIKISFFARRAKKGLGRSPPQELEEGPCSGPHLLVILKSKVPNIVFVLSTLSIVYHRWLGDQTNYLVSFSVCINFRLVVRNRPSCLDFMESDQIA